MYQTSIEVSLFEKTYFVNKLYIVQICIFAQAFFCTRRIFGTILKNPYLFSKKQKTKKKKVREHDYLKWFTAKSI